MTHVTSKSSGATPKSKSSITDTKAPPKVVGRRIGKGGLTAPVKGERRGGRQKGTPNKFGKSIKEAIENAFTKVGGEDYLVIQARKRPQVFLALVGKVLPHSLVSASSTPTPVKINIVVEDASLPDEK